MSSLIYKFMINDSLDPQAPHSQFPNCLKEDSPSFQTFQIVVFNRLKSFKPKNYFFYDSNQKIKIIFSRKLDFCFCIPFSSPRLASNFQKKVFPHLRSSFVQYFNFGIPFFITFIVFASSLFLLKYFQ